MSLVDDKLIKFDELKIGELAYVIIDDDELLMQHGYDSYPIIFRINKVSYFELRKKDYYKQFRHSGNKELRDKILLLKINLPFFEYNDIKHLLP